MHMQMAVVRERYREFMNEKKNKSKNYIKIDSLSKA